eukprot:gnl/Hemi2/13171_TR4506_c0_g1_i1.p1 gnl/Hemi2/13171_TR4506_c0_g1~~gnl/Hemi2/13171_TR4506_c0_g1_i1.p1  ORF type:complete len:602 (+),score=194.04 gnl/Hemi2/13171_TR4506_c0_g1_i1:227-2032(+)
MEGSQLLYNEVVPVRLQLADRPGSDERCAFLTIKLELIVRKSPQNAKQLQLSCTDENDYFFLYTMTVGEEEFQNLKHEQSLLVDFSAFHTHLITLFDRCRNNHDSPKFNCALRVNNADTMLTVIEANAFKNLDHINLRVRQGTDQNIKQHLATKLHVMKTQHQKSVSSFETEISELRSRCERLAQDIQAKDVSHALLTAEAGATQQRQREDLDAWRRSVEAEQAKQREQLASERARWEEEVRGERERWEREKERIESERKHERHRWEEERKKYEEERQRERQKVQTERSRSKEEIEKSSRLNEQEWRRKLDETLQQQAEDHQKELQRLVQSHQAQKNFSEERDKLALSQHKQLEDSLQLYKQTNASLEDKVKASIVEINKGNDIIQRLQKDLRAARTKLKSKNLSLAQQEEKLQKKRDEQESVERRFTDLNRELLERKAEVDRLQAKLADATKQIQDNKTVLASNESMITFLNQKLTDAQLTTRGNPVTSFIPSGYSTQPLHTSSLTSSYIPSSTLDPPRTRLGPQPVAYNPVRPSSAAGHSGGGGGGGYGGGGGGGGLGASAASSQYRAPDRNTDRGVTISALGSPSPSLSPYKPARSLN